MRIDCAIPTEPLQARFCGGALQVDGPGALPDRGASRRRRCRIRLRRGADLPLRNATRIALAEPGRRVPRSVRRLVRARTIAASLFARAQRAAIPSAGIGPTRAKTVTSAGLSADTLAMASSNSFRLATG